MVLWRRNVRVCDLGCLVNLQHGEAGQILNRQAIGREGGGGGEKGGGKEGGLRGKVVFLKKGV